MKNVREDWKKEYRRIYELLTDNPRISVKDITAILGGIKTARKRMEEAFEEQFIIGPQIRKRSYENMGEYMYFLNCEKPEIAYMKYRKDPRVIYHAKIIGFSNLWLICKEKIDLKDLEGEIVVEGYRSDYHVSFAPDHTWEKSLQIMKERVENFDPEKYSAKGTIKPHFAERIEWDEKDKILSAYFKYDLRKPLSPVMEEYKISGGKIYKFLDNLSETCTVFTDYYPETLPAYEPYIFMIETDYEDFLIDLFSELPSTTSFFKVSNKLFVHTHVSKPYMRDTDLERSADRLYIPLLVIDLLEKGIVKSIEYSIVEYSLAKDT